MKYRASFFARYHSFIARRTRTTYAASSRVAPVLVLLGGLMLFGIGVFTNFVLPRWVDAERAQIEALPVTSAGALADTPSGRMVLIEGRIAPSQPLLFREFVAFVREEMDVQRRSQQWREIGRETPLLRLRLPDGEVLVRNTNYDVRNPPTSWDDSMLLTRGSTRYRGFEAGQAVLVLGDATPGGVTAIFISAGTRAEYLAGRDESLAVARVIGAALALIGACVFSGGLLLGRPLWSP